MLRHLNRWHEIHYVAFAERGEREEEAEPFDYCFKAYAIPHAPTSRGAGWFAAKALSNLVDPLPLAIARYRSAGMRSEVSRLLGQGKFDRMVCDFLFATPNIPKLSQALLFEHKLETAVWDRYVEDARSMPAKAFYRIQRNRMARYEAEACRKSAHVVAVSSEDAQRFRTLFGAQRVSEVPTGVDVEAFTRPNNQAIEPKADLVFVGSMNWLPNMDGCNYFVREILPLIRRKKPNCTLAIVGHSPGSGILEIGRSDDKILVTGKVPDMRPYFWGGTVSIAPIRIFGGTRLKIFEAMAAGTPVVSTTIGAEGLAVTHGRNISLADNPDAFAECCLELLDSEAKRTQMAREAYQMVASRFSWEHAARVFEATLEKEVPKPCI